MKNKASISNLGLEPLSILVGEWKTVGMHPFVPEIELHGHVTFEWIEGGSFLKMSTMLEHPEFPDGIALYGNDSETGEIVMLYFDERGTARKYNFSITNNQWKWWRDSSEFSQRFTVEIENNGNTMISEGEMRKKGQGWEKDLSLVYHRI